MFVNFCIPLTVDQYFSASRCEEEMTPIFRSCIYIYTRIIYIYFRLKSVRFNNCTIFKIMIRARSIRSDNVTNAVHDRDISGTRRTRFDKYDTIRRNTGHSVVGQSSSR